MGDCKHCAYCNKDGKLSACSCGTVRYCGKECQREHWSVHKRAHKSCKAAEAFSQALRVEDSLCLLWVGDPRRGIVSSDGTTATRSLQRILEHHPFCTSEYDDQYAFADPQHIFSVCCQNVVRGLWKEWIIILAQCGKDALFAKLQRELMHESDRITVARLRLLHMFHFLDRQIRGLMPPSVDICDSPHGGKGLAFNSIWSNERRHHNLREALSGDLLCLYYGKVVPIREVPKNSTRAQVSQCQTFAVVGERQIKFPNMEFANDRPFTYLTNKLNEIRSASSTMSSDEIKKAVQTALKTYVDTPNDVWYLYSCPVYQYISAHCSGKAECKTGDEISNKYGLHYWFHVDAMDSPLQQLGFQVEFDSRQTIPSRGDVSFRNWHTGEQLTIPNFQLI